MEKMQNAKFWMGLLFFFIPNSVEIYLDTKFYLDKYLIM